jgi:hypothetical protein
MQEVEQMEIYIEDLTKVKGRLLTACRDYEPWADMMYWSGTGDHGVYDFPLDLDQIERIDITTVGVEGSHESITSSPEFN